MREERYVSYVVDGRMVPGDRVAQNRSVMREERYVSYVVDGRMVPGDRVAQEVL